MFCLHLCSATERDRGREGRGGRRRSELNLTICVHYPPPPRRRRIMHPPPPFWQRDRRRRRRHRRRRWLSQDEGRKHLRCGLKYSVCHLPPLTCISVVSFGMSHSKWIKTEQEPSRKSQIRPSNQLLLSSLISLSTSIINHHTRYLALKREVRWEAWLSASLSPPTYLPSVGGGPPPLLPSIALSAWQAADRHITWPASDRKGYSTTWDWEEELARWQPEAGREAGFRLSLSLSLPLYACTCE